MNSLQACNCKAIVKLQCSEIESARALFDLYSQGCKYNLVSVFRSLGWCRVWVPGTHDLLSFQRWVSLVAKKKQLPLPQIY